MKPFNKWSHCLSKIYACAYDRFGECFFYPNLLNGRRRKVEKISLEKWIRAVSKFIALIPCRSINQMKVNFSGVEFESSRKDSIYARKTEKIENPCLGSRVFDRFRPSTLTRYVWVFVLILSQERFQIDSFPIKTLSVFKQNYCISVEGALELAKDKSVCEMLAFTKQRVVMEIPAERSPGGSLTDFLFFFPFPFSF